MLNRHRARNQVRHAILEQEQWIAKCGGDLAGYVRHYGTKGEPSCYGDGGAAIYAADIQMLERLQRKLSTLEGR